MLDLRDPDARRRAQRACGLLKTEAKAIYAVADELGREKRHDPNPAKYQARLVARRVIRNGHLSGDVIAEYINRWAGNRAGIAVAGTPEELRAHADDVWRFAEALENAPTAFVDLARKERRGDGDQGGALPDLAADYLVEYMITWGATNRETAVRLVEREVRFPSSRNDNPEPDPIRRWMAYLKPARARYRARRRRAEAVTEPG